MGRISGFAGRCALRLGRAAPPRTCVHGTDARSSGLAPDERASGLASARHLGHHITEAYPTYCDKHGRSEPPKTMQKAVALAHLRVAEWEPDDDDEVALIPALPASPPQYLPIPSAWWETP